MRAGSTGQLGQRSGLPPWLLHSRPVHGIRTGCAHRWDARGQLAPRSGVSAPRSSLIPRPSSITPIRGTRARSAATDVQAALPSEIAELCGDLPIKQVMLDVLTALDSHSSAVLQAPPGAGKTTTVPLALLRHSPAYLAPDAPGSNEGKTILVLEPRRVAAKAAARRMAAILGEKVGETVGYRVRLETRVSRRTRIEVVTEGVLLRRLQSDPELVGVGAILFDEFHERNLDADLALALTADLQSIARPDLRLLVMSATLGGGLAERCSALLGAATAGHTHTASSTSEGPNGEGIPLAPIVTSEGRSYPVTIKYLGLPSSERQGLETAMSEAVQSVVSQQTKGSVPHGDILCFLPGVAEINNMERLLLKALPYDVDVVTLHGSLDPREQDRVVTFKGNGRTRRVILSTPIAESSLTLNGVTVVVDSGLRRSPAYDANTGVNRLRTEMISQASAEQRAGRAGRQSPGVAYRLWESSTRLTPTTAPEIEQADLAPLALQLACWGVSVSHTDQVLTALPWLDPPPVKRLADAAELLQELGAITDKGTMTADGRAMAGMGVHPRLAAMVQRSTRLNATDLACLLASLLSEKDIILRGRAGPKRPTANITLRLAVLAALAGGEPRNVSGAEALISDLGPLDNLIDSSTDLPSARRVLLGAHALAQSLQPPQQKPTPTATNNNPTHAQQQKQQAQISTEASIDTSTNALSDSDSEESTSESIRLLSDGEDLEGAGSGSYSSDDSESSNSVTSGSVIERSSNVVSERSVVSVRGSEDRSEGVYHKRWIDQAGREGLVGALVALSYPDRLAVRADRSGGRATFALAGGGNVKLGTDDDPLGTSAEFLAIAELGSAREGTGGNDIVRLAGLVNRSAVDRYLKDFITDRNVVFWASGSRTVLARQQKRLGRLVLSERSIPITDEQALPAVLQGFKELGGLRAMGLSKDVEAWRQRLIWLRGTDLTTSGPPTTTLPDLSDAGLLANAKEWLTPYLSGVRSRSDLLKLDWAGIIKGLVRHEDMRRVEREVPSFVLLPTGTKAVIDYSRDPPIARCRIQEVFSLPETPRVAGGRVPVALELLSPSQQPLQITSDLASFWASSYESVKKEGKGRYPKHFWPDNPLEAEATRMTKKAFARAAEREAAQGEGGAKGSGKEAQQQQGAVKAPQKGKKR